VKKKRPTFATHFSKVFEEYDYFRGKLLSDVTRIIIAIAEESFTVEEVRAVIKNLNPKKVGLQSHNHQVAQKVPETKIKFIT